MNFNASRNVNQPKGQRKVKRVSDVNAMGAPSTSAHFPPPAGPGFPPPAGPGFPSPAGPGFSSPAAPGIPTPLATAYSPAFMPASPPPPYHDVSGAQAYPAPNPDYSMGQYMALGAMGGMGGMGQMLQQPEVQQMALQYGSSLAAAGESAVRSRVARLLPGGLQVLRYYFAVDTRYVLRKLLLLAVPFAHGPWAPRYDRDSRPVQPRHDLNAPDLYLPAMGYVTYVLLAGFMLGLQSRFSPEQLAVQASSAFAYILLEMFVYLATLHVSNAASALGTLDLLAYAGYKYLAMLGALGAALLLGRAAYLPTLAYLSLALAYFLVQTLRVQLLSGDSASATAASAGRKRRLYFLLSVALAQPLLCFWLTHHLVPS